MKNHRRIFVIFVALLGFICVVEIWSDFHQDGHQFSGRCEFCHLTTPQVGKPLRFTRSISFLCQECHRMPRDNSHPIGTVPSMLIPEDFLLDWNGRTTCVTCHDPHAHARNHYLRTDERGRDFCIQCHRGLLPMQDPHVGSVSIAHSKSGIYRDDLALSAILDQVSMECLSCHDGVIASDASYEIVGGDAVTYQRQGLSHPIGMDYRKSSLHSRELRPAEALSPYIALYDGKVGCASCHNPYSSEHRMLTMNNSGSDLCLECHLK